MPNSQTKFRIPHVFIFLSIIILFCGVLSYVIPSGKFERVKKKIGHIERTVVIPGSYKEIPKHYSVKGVLVGDQVFGKSTPVSIFGIFMAIPKGLSSAAELIFFVFFIGAVFYVIQHTGTINAIMYRLMVKFRHRPNLLSFFIFTGVAFGSTFMGMGTEFIALIPLFLLVSKELGYDRLYGIGFFLLAEGLGWATAITNPFNVQIAQSIAEVPIGSGMWLRIIYFVLCLAIGFSYLIWYGKRIKKDPTKRVMPDDPFELDVKLKEEPFTKRHLAIGVSFVVLFSVILYSVQNHGWGLLEMTGGFFLVGVVTIFISGMKGDEAMKALVQGLNLMIVPALIIGFARGIQVVMEEGMIIDTILYHASLSLQHLPKTLAAEGMFVFQSVLNFFIPSASGQALVSMPLMVPLGDLLHMTRQTTVFAYTLGDGWSNMVIPTNGFLMAVLAIANIPFNKWIKFILPVFVIFILVAALFLGLAVRFNY
jgi:uncharacterized ion transporter superfamily protein YfcC